MTQRRLTAYEKQMRKSNIELKNRMSAIEAFEDLGGVVINSDKSQVGFGFTDAVAHQEVEVEVEYDEDL